MAESMDFFILAGEKNNQMNKDDTAGMPITMLMFGSCQSIAYLTFDRENYFEWIKSGRLNDMGRKIFEKTHTLSHLSLYLRTTGIGQLIETPLRVGPAIPHPRLVA